MSNPYKLVIFISGNGSNLQAIIDSIAAKTLTAEISLVISDNADAYALKRAKRANIPTQVALPKDFTNSTDYDQHLLDVLQAYQPDLIILAGFMRILSPTVIAPYKNKILNIHPALLPKYKGLNTHKRVLAAGDKKHGVSIHIVTSDLDAGPILAYSELAVASSDTEATLKQRVQNLEHHLYPLVIKWFAEERVTFEQGRVMLDCRTLPAHGKKINLL